MPPLTSQHEGTDASSNVADTILSPDDDTANLCPLPVLEALSSRTSTPESHNSYDSDNNYIPILPKLAPASDQPQSLHAGDGMLIQRDDVFISTTPSARQPVAQLPGGKTIDEVVSDTASGMCIR